MRTFYPICTLRTQCSPASLCDFHPCPRCRNIYTTKLPRVPLISPSLTISSYGPYSDDLHSSPSGPCPSGNSVLLQPPSAHRRTISRLLGHPGNRLRRNYHCRVAAPPFAGTRSAPSLRLRGGSVLLRTTMPRSRVESGGRARGLLAWRRSWHRRCFDPGWFSGSMRWRWCVRRRRMWSAS